MLKANHIVTGTICLGPNSAKSCFFSMTFNEIVKVGVVSVVEKEKVKDLRSKKYYDFSYFKKRGRFVYVSMLRS